MPNYTFELRDGSDPIEDDVGVIPTDRQDACQYARGVVRELMSGREAQTRTWRLDVYENGEKRVFAITFASLDETLAHRNPNCGCWWRACASGTGGSARRRKAPCGNRAPVSHVRAASPTSSRIWASKR